MARPKSHEKKKQVNLTITKEVIDMAKEVAAANHQSLSQMTETSWRSIHNTFYGLRNNPKGTIQDITNLKEQVEQALKILEQKEEESKK